MALVLHVDEVVDDDSAEVAQPKVPRDFVHGLHVRPERRLLEVFLVPVLARVDVDRDERLGLVDDDRAAALQVDLPLEDALDLVLDLARVEQRPAVGVELHALLAAAITARRNSGPA